MRRFLLLILVGVLLTASLLIPFGKVQANGSVSGADMIAMMNSWRSSYWSNALIENASLNSCAQWTAEEMARINANNHLAYLGYTSASSRCSQYGFGGGKTVFVTENWARHTNMTIDILADYWGDHDHMLPATSAQYQYVGVGVATASDGETYYILQAGAISGETAPSSNTTTGGSTVSEQSNTTNFVQPVVTATPNSDGDTYHVVLYGQSLFAISTWYGVTVEKIKELNSLTSDAIYEGQKLLISIKPTPTITPTRTATVPQPTRTLTSTKAPPTLAPTITVTPTPKPSIGSTVKKIDRQYLGFGILLISAIGFLIVLLKSFLKPIPKK
jgi:LysM repeat protein